MGKFTCESLLAEIRLEYRKELERKTGWGKNEVAELFDRVCARVALRTLD